MWIRDVLQTLARSLTSGKAVSEAPDFTRSGTYWDRFSDFSSRGWLSNRNWGTSVDYRKEVGSLDGHSLVMAVVNYTASRLPEAVPTVETVDSEGTARLDPLHPLARLIRRPNKHHIWANYAHGCALSEWVDGNVYFKKVRDVTGQLVELWYVPHYLIEPRWPNDERTPEVPRGRNLDTFLSHYQFTVPGRKPELWPASDVLHLKRAPLAESRKAPSPFEPLVKELYGDDKMALFTATIMRNMGLQVPLIAPATDNQTISIDNGEAMKQQWMLKTTGDKAGEPVVMLDPVKVDKFGFSPQELDLSRLRLIPESRVAAVTGIPAATLQLLVGLENGTSYASSEQARQQGYEEVIIPIQNRWAEEFNWQLLPEFEGTQDAKFRFDTSRVRVLEEDKDALVKREVEKFRSGATTYDQFLTAVGDKAIGPPLGELRLIPGIATPMTADRLLQTANGTQETAPIDPAMQELAKMADIDRWMSGLDREMREFMKRHADTR